MMQKSYLILTILLFMIVGYAAVQIKINIEGRTSLSENLDDFNVYLANLKLNGTEIEGINDTKDGYVINVPSKGTLEYDIVNESTEYDVEASVECEETNEQKTWTFDYTGGEQTFVAPASGTYKLETWGAQGYSVNSYVGGYGGYSVGKINLEKNSKLYVYVGEKGKGGIGNETKYSSYPNSINASANDKVSYTGSGGGSTHIAFKGSLIKDITNLADLIMVSGGGGASAWTTGNYWAGTGGSGGGYKGNSGKSTISDYLPGGGGSQTSGGTAGNAGTAGSLGISETNRGCITLGGGGYYGGGASWGSAGGGGSGYIGNSLLTEKSMYCYNCSTSTEESTKTISTTCAKSTATENCAKTGNGYARITGINIELPKTQLTSTTIEAQDKLNNKVEIENNGMKCNLKIKKLSRTEKKIYTGPAEWTFDYTGSEQTFTVPTKGTYKLETWGAEGGGAQPGYGGYSIGNINLNKETILYINIGGAGTISTNGNNGGGYNGGGNGSNNIQPGSGGGGATHIASLSGLLATFENKKDVIYIVSGGGGGSIDVSKEGVGAGGSGGGFNGVSGGYYKNLNWYFFGTGGTQTTGGVCYLYQNQLADSNSFGSFGLGGNHGYETADVDPGGSGGGGGFYGGGGSSRNHGQAGGGSGYIGNSLLTEKSMYCYNCTESTEEETKTISTTCVNEEPTENCAKKGNGYAKITLIK